MNAPAAANDRVLIGKQGPIGSIVFNNPEKRNAIALDMSLAAAEAMDDFAADPAIRVIVISGAGDKAFISGGDISSFEKARATPEQVAEYDRKASRFRRLLRSVGKPTVAKIRGYCLGGGLSVAMHCDLRVSEDAQFGIPAARLGIGYGAEAIELLIGLVGPSRAKEILFTARRYKAAEALAMGLVNQVAPAVELDAQVAKLAETMANNAPLSIVSAKCVIDELTKDADRRDTAAIKRVVDACFASQDYIEGRRAFMEKRKPLFTGR